MLDPDDDALPRARRRPGDAPQADQPREARRCDRAHGGRAVAGISVLPGATASWGWCPHNRATAQRSQGRPERTVSLRLREEVQAVLRRGDCELSALWLHLCLESPEPRRAIICVSFPPFRQMTLAGRSPAAKLPFPLRFHEGIRARPNPPPSPIHRKLLQSPCLRQPPRESALPC